MKSIKNFFPTVGGSISNKRQKLTETAYALSGEAGLGNIDSAEKKEESETKSRSSSPMKGLVTDPAISGSSEVSFAWKPFDEMESSWKNRLSSEYSKPYFQKLLNFLNQEYNTAKIFPPANQIFTALNLCPYDKVKVVVIGQDPYHGPGQAHGLAFSVQRGVQIPPSLRNMFMEAENDVHITRPTHGNLENWSRQGVLLLNTCLTVRQGQANSHQKRGWEEFTDAIVRELRKKQGIVYLLWGKPAQTKCTGIDTSKNRILQSSHPSPLSATKTNEPFMGSKMFSRCNNALIELGEEPINWQV